MHRRMLMLLAATFVGVAPAAAQVGGGNALSTAPTPPATAPQEAGKGTGAKTVEVTVVPIGMMLFRQTDTGQPKFTNYALGGSVNGNINKWVGVEGDVGYALGVHQDLTINAIPVINQKAPNMLTWTGNVLISPGGSNHKFAPYIVGGAGGLTVLNTTDAISIGPTGTETYLTTDVGGGARWFVASHLGVRADYRFVMIHNKDTAPLFFTPDTRYAHRLYAALVVTY